jgi:hypothetical protein
MNAPFFAQLQQYVMRVISGLIILIMYYTNMSWAAYMPINSNTAFNNKMESYNVSAVLTADNKVNIDNYKAYGPPYYAVANLFVTGATYVYYTFSIVYVFIKYWGPLKKAFVGMVINTWKRQSIYTGFEDGQARMMRKYKEVPEWWVRKPPSLSLLLSPPHPPAAHSLDLSCFRLANSTFCGQYSIVFLFGLIISIIAVTAWPTETPWWSILVVVGVGAVLTIPWVIIESIASAGISLGAIWQVLPGVIWPGNPLAQLVILMLVGAFEQLAGGFTQNLKYAH